MVKYLGKKVVALGGALLFSTLANAVEVYNKDGDTFSLGGRILVGTESLNNLNGANDDKAKYGEEFHLNSLRINIAGTSELGNGWKGFAAAEYEFNMNDVRALVRQSYAGLKNDHYSVSFGKDYSAYYQVAEFTDIFSGYGAEASTFRALGDNKGTERVKESALLQYYTDKLHVSFMGAMGTNFEITDASGNTLTDIDGFQITDNDGNPVLLFTKDYEHNGSLRYNLADNFRVGVAYSTIHYTLDLTQDNFTTQRFVYGFTYNPGNITLALLGIAAQDYGISDGYYNGSEGVLSYKLTELGNRVYVGYNYLALDDNGEKVKQQNYVEVGYDHYFTKRLYAYTFYKYDARSDTDMANIKEYAEIDGPGSSLIGQYNTSNGSTFGAYLRYSFY
jgi:predicted porin